VAFSHYWNLRRVYLQKWRGLGSWGTMQELRTHSAAKLPHPEVKGERRVTPEPGKETQRGLLPGH
jgi:hypothetical protein